VVVSECWYTTASDGARTQRLLAQLRPPVLGLAVTNIPQPRPPLFSRSYPSTPASNGARGVARTGQQSAGPVRTRPSPPAADQSPAPPPGGWVTPVPQPSGWSAPSYQDDYQRSATGTSTRVPSDARSWSDEGPSYDPSSPEDEQTPQISPPPPSLT
jgi:hypothetical protein